MLRAAFQVGDGRLPTLPWRDGLSLNEAEPHYARFSDFQQSDGEVCLSECKQPGSAAKATENQTGKMEDGISLGRDPGVTPE